MVLQPVIFTFEGIPKFQRLEPKLDHESMQDTAETCILIFNLIDEVDVVWGELQKFESDLSFS